MRPIPPVIPEGQSWDAYVDDTFKVIFNNPVPIATYPNAGSLPSPSENQFTLAFADHALYFCNGITWLFVGTSLGTETLLYSKELTGTTITDQVDIPEEWRTFNNLILELDNVNKSGGAFKPWISFQGYNSFSDSLEYFIARQGSHSATTLKYFVSPDDWQGNLASTQSSGFRVRVNNDPNVEFRSLSLDDLYGFDSSGNTLRVNDRRNMEVSFAGAGNQTDCPIIQSSFTVAPGVQEVVPIERVFLNYDLIGTDGNATRGTFRIYGA